MTPEYIQPRCIYTYSSKGEHFQLPLPVSGRQGSQPKAPALSLSMASSVSRSKAMGARREQASELARAADHLCTGPDLSHFRSAAGHSLQQPSAGAGSCSGASSLRRAHSGHSGQYSRSGSFGSEPPTTASTPRRAHPAIPDSGRLASWSRGFFRPPPRLGDGSAVDPNALFNAACAHTSLHGFEPGHLRSVALERWVHSADAVGVLEMGQ